MEPRLSNARHSLPTGYARLAVVLACLLASGLLPLSATGAQAPLPAESQTPWEDGGQEPEVIKFGTRTVTPAQSQHPGVPPAPRTHPHYPTATRTLGCQTHPTGRLVRPLVLRC